MHNAPQKGSITVVSDGRDVHLSPTESEILQLYGAGKSVTEIAAVRCKSIKTVSAQLARMQDKISVQSRAELRVFAAQWALTNQGA